MKNWLFLSVAIVAEVFATSCLKASDGFTRLWPSLAVIAGYAVAFYFLSLTLRTIPVGVAYAVWAGVGLALITLVAWILYGQKLGIIELTGITLIAAGVILLSLYTKPIPH